jgi:2-polyprenyl-6-hydroxyphenyl methylase / 3-demethylubiquinone-9 3-methyltransferase
MDESGYFDRIWASVPAGLEPERFALRRAFLLAGVAAGERVLDVGCGEGAFTAALAAHGAATVGVEVAAEPLRRAAATHPDLDLRLVDAGAALPFDDGSFDVVWAGEVLEHVVDVVGLLDELWRVLRDRGRLLASTPNHPRAKLLWLAVSAPAFDAHFDPRADHVRFFSGRTLRLVLETTRFDPVRVSAAGGVPGLRPVLLATAHKPPA